MSQATTITDLADYDVSDPTLYQQDSWRPIFAHMRRDDPVHYCPDSIYGPYWSVTKYDDIMQVELDHDNFSSELGGIQVLDPPAGHDRPNFIRMDPPKHTAQRKTVAPVVGPKNLKNFEATIRERTNYVLDSLPRNEVFDWVDLVSIELTTMMLATLFDFPWEDRRLLPYWSDVGIANINDPDALVKSEEERTVEMMKMGAYFKDLWDQRAEGEPNFDLISMMARGEATKEMPMAEFVGNIGLLIVGGNDTTRNSMTAGLMALQDNPDEFRKLRADPSLIKSMVPEIIRYHTPVIHMRRTAARDIELAGKMIKAGERVVMWYLSGNFDESAIYDAERFVIDRKKARRHLAFGAGIHRCVGDRLAEQQLRILWEEILARDLEIEVMGEPTRIYSNFIRGISSLPARINA